MSARLDDEAKFERFAAEIDAARDQGEIPDVWPTQYLEQLREDLASSTDRYVFVPKELFAALLRDVVAFEVIGSGKPARTPGWVVRARQELADLQDTTKDIVVLDRGQLLHWLEAALDRREVVLRAVHQVAQEVARATAPRKTRHRKSRRKSRRR